MSDDLDELERRVIQHPEVIASCDVRLLIERCRKAEAARDECERQFQAKVEDVASEIELRLKAEQNAAYWRSRYDAAQSELDSLNAAMKEGAEAEKELASRWPEAVERVREQFGDPLGNGTYVDLICRRIEELAAPEAGKEE